MYTKKQQLMITRYFFPDTHKLNLSIFVFNLPNQLETGKLLWLSFLFFQGFVIFSQ